jgi:ATP/maltotriose-dependent transcriptional regulator MalT
MHAGLPPNQIATIGIDSLRFRASETSEFVERLGLALATRRRVLGQIRECEGWPYAVDRIARLYLNSVTAQDEAYQPIESIIASIMESQLRRLPARDVKLLRRVANVECITRGVCESVLEIPDSRERLRSISALCPFLIYNPASDAYALHPLFRAHLLRSLADEHPFTAEMHRLVAARLGESGDHVPEVRHLVAAGELDEASVRIAAIASDLVITLRARELIDLIDLVSTVAREPISTDLVRWKVRAQVAIGETSLAVITATRAISLPSTDPSDRITLHLTRSYARRYQGSFDLARMDAETALLSARHLSPAQHVKVLRLVGSMCAGDLVLEDAARYFSEALALATESGLDRQQVLVLCDIATWDCLAGDVDSAIRNATAAATLADLTGNVSGLTLALNNLAAAQHLDGAYTQAFATVEAVLSLAHRFDQVRLEALAWIEQGELYADLEQLDDARACMRTGVRLARDLAEPGPIAHARRGLVTIARLVLDLAEGRRLLDEPPALPAPDRYSQVLNRIVEGALCFDEGELRLARYHFARAVQKIGEEMANVSAARVRLHLAQVELLERGIAHALPYLDSVAAIVTRLGHNQFLIPMAARMPRLWGALDSAGRPDLYEIIAQPDLRPHPRPTVRGLPPSARYDDPHPSLLTSREREIVFGLCEGLDRAQIAARIGRSRNTVDKAISLIYAATGFEHCHQLVAWAGRCGLYAHPTPPPSGRLQR